MKIFKNKKGFNDAYIVGVIVMILFAIGLMIPFVNSEFGTTTAEFNVDGVSGQFVDSELQDTNEVKIGDVLKSIGKIFFWTFGDIPFWLDGILVVMRIILLFVLVKNLVPFIGGG